jgi:hypothetical protein
MQVGKEQLFFLVMRPRLSPTQSDIYQMSCWYNWFSWWWARGCSKHVENSNKHTEKIVRQIGHLPGIIPRCTVKKCKDFRQCPLLISTYIHRYAVTSLPRRCDYLLYKEFPATKLCKLRMNTCRWEYINVSPKQIGVNLWIELNRLRAGYSGRYLCKW